MVLLGEYLLDLYLTVCCSDTPEDFKKSKELFNNIYVILKKYRDNITEDTISIDLKSKIDLTFYLSQYRQVVKDFRFEQLIAKLSEGKFQNMIPVLDIKRKKMDTEELEGIYNITKDKKKLILLTEDYEEIDNLLSDIKTGNYNDDTEIINKWEEKITQTYGNVLQNKKAEAISSASHLDLLKDDYTSVLEKFRSRIDSKDIIKTGYEKIDGNLPTLGFERRRIYIFGGESGVGKSALLINLICNAIRSNINMDKNDPAVYLYITAENLIDESLIRFYCCLTEESNISVINRLKSDPTFNIKTKIQQELEKYNSNVIFYYVTARKTSVYELESLVDITKTNYKNLRAVYADYLDLFRSGTDTKEYRFELGTVTQAMKNIAVAYDIAFITATQLNRGGYNRDMAASLVQVGESIQKVENSDFICFLQNTNDAEYTVTNDIGEKLIYKRIRATVLKNRNGAVGYVFMLGILHSNDGKDSFNYKIIELSNYTNDGFENTDNSGGELDLASFGL